MERLVEEQRPWGGFGCDLSSLVVWLGHSEMLNIAVMKQRTGTALRQATAVRTVVHYGIRIFGSSFKPSDTPWDPLELRGTPRHPPGSHGVSDSSALQVPRIWWRCDNILGSEHGHICATTIGFIAQDEMILYYPEKMRHSNTSQGCMSSRKPCRQGASQVGDEASKIAKFNCEILSNGI